MGLLKALYVVTDSTLSLVGSDSHMNYGSSAYPPYPNNVPPYVEGAMFMPPPYGICYYDNRSYSNMVDETLLKDYIRRQMYVTISVSSLL